VGGHRQPGSLLTAPLIGSTVASGRAQAARVSPYSPVGRGSHFVLPWWPKPFVCRERGGEMPSCCRSGRAAGTRGSHSTHTGGTGGERGLPRFSCSLSLSSGLGVQPSTTVRGFLPAAQLCIRERDSAPSLFSCRPTVSLFFPPFLSPCDVRKADSTICQTVK